MADISTTTRDENNIAHLTSNTIVALKYVDISASRFSNPDSNYYGYAADGYYREAGVSVGSPSTGQPAKSSWAVEGEHSTATASRGLEDAFPKRIFVITTSVEVVILDADDLAVWIRFSLATGGAFTDYYCLGGSNTSIVDADFNEGVLAVVVSDGTVTQMNGLVIVDFRRDKMYLSGSAANATEAGQPINTRNAAATWTASPGSLSNMGQKSSTVNNVSMVVEQNQAYIATSHNDGITLLKMKPGSSGYAIAARTTQAFEQSYTSVNYNAVDDYDGDSTTPIFYASNYSEWVSDNIRSGDGLLIGANSYRIESVGTTQLTLSDEIPVSTTATGGSYKILRRVDRVLFRTLTSFFYTNGEGLVVQQQDQTWQTTDDDMTPFDNPDYQASTEGSTSVRDLCVRSGLLFVATDAGVFRVTLSDVSAGLPSSLAYSSSSGDGDYKILANELATALAVDTDSGHLLVATYDGSSSSEVVEVDVDNFHQKVLTTTGTVEVNALIGYTNPNGPPTVSV